MSDAVEVVAGGSGRLAELPGPDGLSEAGSGRSGRPRRSLTSSYSVLLAQVQQAGLLRRRRGYYAVKLGLSMAALAGVWVVFAFLGDHWIQLVLAAALGVVIVQVIFISHEAAHRQIFRRNRPNEVLALLLGALVGGISLSWWQNKHSKHHGTPNQVGKDPDINPSVVHFYVPGRSPGSRLGRFLHQRQGWWFFPLLIVEALNLHAQSVAWLALRARTRYRAVEIVLMLIRLGLYPAVLFVFLSPGIAAAFLGTQLAVVGVYLGVCFAASHIGMPVAGREVRIDFLCRQVLMSRNVSGGVLASFAMGGLNYQIEHHLFPNMPGANLRRARPLVRQFCLDHDIIYQQLPIHQAWAAVAAHLNRVGLRSATAFACPAASLLRTV